MARKEFKWKGLNKEQIKALSLEEFTKLTNSNNKRKIQRGFTEQEKILLKKIRSNESNIKTHCRSMLIIPEMIDVTIGVYNGKTFNQLNINEEMLGHKLGEFSLSRAKAKHAAPGIGAKKKPVR